MELSFFILYRPIIFKKKVEVNKMKIEMNQAHAFFDNMQKKTGVALNEVQQKAVLHTDGPMLLLASPGSGKTTTIIMKIGYLLQEKEIQPSKIKAVTFSRASAQDMTGRFRQLFPELPPVDFSTIHSFALRVVRQHLQQTNTDIQMIEGSTVPIGPEGVPLHKKMILRHLFETVAGTVMTEDQLDELTTYISFLKNKMIPRKSWGKTPCDVPHAAEIAGRYEDFKRTGYEKLLVDFDDMLTMANDILEGDVELLKEFQQLYEYILVDESQDTSLVQHAILEKLAEEHRNICMVADDDQSIYSWRGAEPAYLLNIKKVYPDAAVFFMEQNYRSSKEIVTAANLFIQRNKKRYDKKMHTKNPAEKPIVFREFVSGTGQVKHLVKEISELENLSQAAVLYRNNSSSIMLMNAFDRAGIPFYMKDVDNKFFSHWVVEDILNFMRMTFTEKRPDLLEKIYTKMNGYLTKQQMTEVKKQNRQESVFDTLLRQVPLKDYQIKKISDTRDTLREMKGMPPVHAIRVIRDRLGYDKAIERMCERLGFRKEYLNGILSTLEEIALPLETMEEFAERLKYLERALKTSKNNQGENAVTLSTFHSAKGLEFDRVYMIDLIEGVIPSAEDAKPGSEDNMEEAARLFYVGMTRARAHLEMISYVSREGEDAECSRFLSEVKKLVDPNAEKHRPSDLRKGESEARDPNTIMNFEELRPGLLVRHRKFGPGKVKSFTPEKIRIQFHRETKTFGTSFCLDEGLLVSI